MSTTSLTPRYVSPAGAAPILGCSVPTVLRMISRGALVPVGKLPGRTGSYVLDRSDVERVAAERVEVTR